MGMLQAARQGRWINRPKTGSDLAAIKTFLLEQSSLLVWHGSIHLHMGRVAQAVAYLREVQQRIQGGQIHDATNGGVHGVLGHAYWLQGQWDLAAIAIRLALELPHDVIKDRITARYTDGLLWIDLPKTR